MRMVAGAVAAFLVSFFALSLTSSFGTGFRLLPLAPPSVVKLYQDTADTVSQETVSAASGGGSGVTVPWQELLVIDAVRRNQDLTGITEAMVRDLVERFVVRHERACPPVVPVPPAASSAGAPDAPAVPWQLPLACVPTVTFTLLSHDAVMTDLGFTTEQRSWAQEMLAAGYISALADVGADCVPTGWTPSPQPGWLWPVSGVYTITSCYGPRVDPVEFLDAFHYGLDVGAPAGTPILAVAPGTVTLASEFGHCGLAVEIKHSSPGGPYTQYCHMSATAVSPGERVAAGQVIGYIGSTGKSTGPHLHLVYLMPGRAYQDPLLLFH